MENGQIVNSLVVVGLNPFKVIADVVLVLLFITTHHMGYYWSSSEISGLYGKKSLESANIFL